MDKAFMKRGHAASAENTGLAPHFHRSLHVAWRRPETMKIAARVWDAWERMHPCLLASASRSLPEISQARMPALPGSIF